MQNLFSELERDLKHFMLSAPRMAGNYAVSHFKDNIRKRGGMPSGGRLNKFKERSHETGRTRGKRILMGRGNLVDSIRLISADNGKVVVGIDHPGIKEYAAIHQNGGEIPVTAKMKRYFWSQYYKNGGRAKNKRVSVNSDAEFWKRMALKKTGSKIRMPKRQFMGITPDLAKGIERELKSYAKQLGLL